MSKSTERIIEDLQGVKGQGFLLVVMLKDFAQTFERVASMKPGAIDALLVDIENDPQWFDKWGKWLDMGTHLMVYMVAADSLLKEYTAECIREHNRKQLEGG